MTGQIIRLRKSKKAFIAGITFLLSWSSHAWANQEMRVPVLHNVGVIPVQFADDQTRQEIAPALQAITAAFPKAVENARRFRILNTDLTAELWPTEAGRQDLVQQYELHGFASLQIESRSGAVTVNSLLLSPGLAPLLRESDSSAASWWQTAAPADVTRKVENLVFRLFNRLPVDVSVTSVQGTYVTLSGGRMQGVQNGDQVDLVRASVKPPLHPANGTWLQFRSFPLGKATVVDVKEHTSVAKLDGLTYENAVTVGDGAKISALAQRRRFARQQGQNNRFQASSDPETIIVAPLYPENSTVPANNNQGNQSGDSSATQPSTPANQTLPADPVASTPANNDMNTDESSPWDDFDLKNVTRKVVDDIVGTAGARWWSVSGPVSESGNFPLWLINHVGASFSKTVLFKIHARYGGSLMFGTTDETTYFGYDSHARIYWKDSLDIADGFVSSWMAGGTGQFYGINVPKGPFGGGDWVRGGFFGGLEGTVTIGQPGTRYDWFTELAVMPLNIGRFGYEGQRHQVESSFGWVYELGAYRVDESQPIQFGGAIKIGDERETLANGRRPHIQDYQISVLGKYTL